MQYQGVLRTSPPPRFDHSDKDILKYIIKLMLTEHEPNNVKGYRVFKFIQMVPDPTYNPRHFYPSKEDRMIEIFKKVIETDILDHWLIILITRLCNMSNFNFDTDISDWSLKMIAILEFLLQNIIIFDFLIKIRDKKIKNNEEIHLYASC
jgi:hypothetical protein